MTFSELVAAQQRRIHVLTYHIELPMIYSDISKLFSQSTLHRRTQYSYVNSMLPRDYILRYRTWSISIQVMPCSLAAPRHYLYQCWLACGPQMKAILQEVHNTPITECVRKLWPRLPGRKVLRRNIAWWRHQMETFSALLALCVVNSPVTV